MSATVDFEGAGPTEPPASVVHDSSGLGGAGAFIPPAHVNGVFDAGGLDVGVGGAGAFIRRGTATP
jgi:hypothetical protein